jgi:3-carboxy-cis,cis-muconate cycloisomerase
MKYQSAIFSKYLSDDEMAAIVSDEAWIKHMLHFETALANALAIVGLGTRKNAEEIKEEANKLQVKAAALAAGTLKNGVPVITLLEIIKPKLSAEAKQQLHFGATSQDVMDTAQVLIIKEALAVLEQRTSVLIKSLNKLSKRFGKTPCMAHTRGQQAMPFTFQTKVNAWQQPLQRQLVRLKEIKQRLLLIQFGGAVGTLAVYGNKGKKISAAFAKEIKLKQADSWHTQRDNLSEFTNWLAMLTSILGKMGADILVMSQSEINEVVENADGGGKSSAMPNKNNPVLSEALVAIAKMNAGLQSQLLLSMIHQNERDATAWILEWNAVPQMLINAATALNHAVTISSKMKVNAENMKGNIEQFLKNSSAK